MAQTLVVHPGALGDVLLAVPALRALRGAHPNDPLVLAAQPRIGALLRELRVVDTALDFDSLGLDAFFVEDPPPERVRVVAEAARVVCWFGARDPGFVRRLGAVARDVVIGLPAVTDGPVWEYLLGTLGPDRPPLQEPLRVSPQLLDEGRRALTAIGWDGRPLLMVHPGGAGIVKRWPADGFVQVITAFASERDVALVLHEGPADREAVRPLLSRLPEPPLWLDNPSLPVLAGALRHVRLYLGNDSGISHLAATVGARAIVLFTSGTLAWRPWSSTVDCIVVSTLSLFPQDVDSVRAALARVWPVD